MSRKPNFDRIARAYRWMEYATLGRSLERARECYLDRLGDRRCALVLGDGDGRFTAKLLAVNDQVFVEAVDSSAAMLALLAKRAGEHRLRVQVVAADGLAYVPRVAPDLVVTHFFLDCFGQKEVEVLARRLAGSMATEAIWVVTEFRVPDGAMRLPGWVLVRGLYLAFRLLTGLRTTALPDHGKALRETGLTLEECRFSLFGLLTSEVWRKG